MAKLIDYNMDPTKLKKAITRKGIKPTQGAKSAIESAGGKVEE